MAGAKRPIVRICLVYNIQGSPAAFIRRLPRRILMEYRVKGYQPCAHMSKAVIGHAVPLPLHLADHSHIGGYRRRFAVRFSTNHERDDAPDTVKTAQVRID